MPRKTAAQVQAGRRTQGMAYRTGMSALANVCAAESASKEALWL